MIDCVLFEPDIPQNTGTIMRLGACFGVPVHIVHPCGFALSDRNFRRAGLDYLARSDLVEHDDFAAFCAWRAASGRRLVAFTTHGDKALPDFAFRSADLLLFGRESAGLPDSARQAADVALRIPIAPGNRSLNVAAAAAIGIYEALRQTGQMP